MKFLSLLFALFVGLLFSDNVNAQWETAILDQEIGKIGRFHVQCRYVDNAYGNFQFDAVVKKESCPLYIKYDPQAGYQIPVLPYSSDNASSPTQNHQ